LTVKLSVNRTVLKFSSVHAFGKNPVGSASISPEDLKAETNSHKRGNMHVSDRIVK
jgi:hypothetical protein